MGKIKFPKEATRDLSITEGVEGTSIYVNDFRIIGNKPWGGGKSHRTLKIRRINAIESIEKFTEVLKQITEEEFEDYKKVYNDYAKLRAFVEEVANTSQAIENPYMETPTLQYFERKAKALLGEIDG